MKPAFRLLHIVFLLAVAVGSVPVNAEQKIKSDTREARAKSIEATLANARQRLKRLSPHAEQLRQTIRKMKPRDWSAIGLGPKAVREWNLTLAGENLSFQERPNTLEALRQFDAELKRRGIDLILLPVPDHPLVYGHRLDKRVTSNEEFAPGYTKMLIELMENDIEVIDVLDQFREAGEKETDKTPPVLRPDDHHWASTGMAIAADQINQRLQRYDWAQALAKGRSQFKKREVKWDKKIPAIEIVYSGKLPNADNSIKKNRDDYHLWSDWPHPVLLMGDSFVYHEAYTAGRKKMRVGTGQGIAHHLSAELGSLVPFRGRAAGGKQVPEEYFARFDAKDENQPKVLIWIAGANALAEKDWRILKTIPKPKNTDDDDSQILKVKIRITQVSPAPDPKTSPYDQALRTMAGKVLDGKLKGQTLTLVQTIMSDRKIIRENASLKTGDEIELKIRAFDAQVRNEPKLKEIQLIDTLTELDLDRYWVIPDTP